MVLTVADVFRKLSYSELKNLAVAVDGTGTIKKDKQNEVVEYINDALTKLHTRFQLIQADSILALTGLEQQENLPAEAIQVVSLVTAWGQSLSFGTHPIPGEFYVYQRKLWVPANTISELQITYQNRHPVIAPIAAPADLDQEIDLVDDLVKALTAWVGYLAYRDMRTPDAAVAANDLMARYEVVCAEAVANGLVPGELLPVQKFESRGWV